MVLSVSLQHCLQVLLGTEEAAGGPLRGLQGVGAVPDVNLRRRNIGRPADGCTRCQARGGLESVLLRPPALIEEHGLHPPPLPFRHCRHGSHVKVIFYYWQVFREVWCLAQGKNVGRSRSP